MRQLRPEDARFVFADSGHANANVTLVYIYDPTHAGDGRVHFKELLAHIGSRLHLSPVFRQKLLRVPLDLDLPYWIEDERFDLEYHVRHIALPSPGDWRQFCIQASRIHARPLDMSRPLWEMYLVEGLDSFLDLPKHSFAIMTKTHHAAIDDNGAAEITSLLHDLTPDPIDPSPPEPWFPESPPGLLSMMARATLNSVSQPFAAAAPLARTARRLAPVLLGTLGDALLHSESMPISRFNAEVSPHRVFETRRFTLEEFKQIRALAPGASVNDVVLAVCGGALRRYLAKHEELPEKQPARGAAVLDACRRHDSGRQGGRNRGGHAARTAGHRDRGSGGTPAQHPQAHGRPAWDEFRRGRERTDRPQQARVVGDRRPRRAAVGGQLDRPAGATCGLHDHERAGPVGAPLPRRRAHDVLLGDPADIGRHGPRLRGDQLRRPRDRLADLVPRADAGSGVLRAVHPRSFPGLPGGCGRTQQKCGSAASRA